jgi:hypothetical protein
MLDFVKGVVAIIVFGYIYIRVVIDSTSEVIKW